MSQRSFKPSRGSNFQDLEASPGKVHRRGGRSPGGSGSGNANSRLSRCSAALRSRSFLIAVAWVCAFALVGVVMWTSVRSSAATTARSVAHTRLSTKYSVVIDAGSTGSRVHVYTFAVGAPSEVSLSDEAFVHIKPGLSSYAGDAKAAAASLRPLLDKAVATIPLAERAATRIFIGATAGLRLLPGSQSSDILAAVRTLLESYPFAWSPLDVAVMDGRLEAQFAFVALNYLLGTLRTSPVSIIDLGGGSVQVAHALAHTTWQHPLAKTYVADVKVPGARLSLYTHSYLSYGLMAARAAVLSGGSGAAEDCIPFGWSGSFDYKRKKIPAFASRTVGAASFEKCAVRVAKAMKIGAPCGAPPKQCAFNGAWRGGAGPIGGPLHLMSYLYERIAQANAAVFVPTATPETPKGIASLRTLATAARDICSLGLDELKAAPRYRAAFDGSDGSDGADAPYFCLDLVFIHTLLAQGLRVDVAAPLTLVKKLPYHAKPVEATWSLGAGIRSIGGASSADAAGAKKVAVPAASA